MREILFRGKRVDNGKWVYGYLLITQMSGVYIIGTKTKSKPHKIGGEIASVSIGDVVWQYEVDPATVGQYTGLKDKNGREIYEGDICRIITNQMVSEEPFTIIWSEEYAQWFWKDNEMEDGFWTSIAKTCEIIGNIHENPELLEGVDKCQP